MAVRIWVLAIIVAVMLAPFAAAAEGHPATVAYDEGRRLYDLGEWDKAIEKFKEAYKLRPEAAPLFNIAQAYRLKGDCLQASRTYKAYRRNFPDAPKMDKVERFIRELEDCAAKQEATSPPAESSPSTPVETTPTVTTEPSTTSGRRTWMWIAAGTSVAFLATGVAFGVKARGGYDEYQQTDDQTRYFVLRNQIRSDERIANIAFIGGGAMAVVAGVLYFVARRNESNVTVSIHPTGAGVLAQGRF